MVLPSDTMVSPQYPFVKAGLKKHHKATNKHMEVWDG